MTITDQNVDKMLREVYNAKAKGGAGFGYMLDYTGEQYDQISGSRIAKILHDKGLVDWKGYPDGAGGADMMYITYKGEKFQEAGGWIAHMEIKADISGETKKITEVSHTVNVFGDNNGVLGHDFFSSNSPTSINIKPEKKKKPQIIQPNIKRQSKLLQFWLLISENKLIAGILLIILTIIMNYILKYFNMNSI